MANHTVGSLMKLLEQFPKDLPITNEISLIWFYPDELEYLKEENDYSVEEYQKLTREHSTDLCIFEGSWENGDIVDKDNTMDLVISKYEDKE